VSSAARLSVGRLDTVLALLSRLSEMGPLSPVSVSRLIEAEGTMGGSVPLADALLLSRSAGLIDSNDRFVLLTQRGRTLSEALVEDGRRTAMRELLFRLIAGVRRDLLVLAYMSADDIVAFADSEVLQCLLELQLIGLPPEPSAEAWWERLRFSARQADDEYLKNLGDRAEALTMRYERDRLVSVERHDLAARVCWVSRLNEGAGFDVLSFIGDATNGQPVDQPLRVEVKACGRTGGSGPRFFLTRNEWEVAAKGDLPYVFHVWTTTQVHSDRGGAPRVISGAEVVGAAPKDEPGRSRWTECVIDIEPLQ
jgi:hypothetical protein